MGDSGIVSCWGHNKACGFDYGHSLSASNERELRARVTELAKNYEERVMQCRSDRETAQAKIDQQQSIEGLASVQVIAKLHTDFNADLGSYSSWSLMKTDFDYTDFCCDEIEEREFRI